MYLQNSEDKQQGDMFQLNRPGCEQDSIKILSRDLCKLQPFLILQNYFLLLY